ncbi:hypothetical protein GCM10009825_18720 [Arthrobacter humicola]|uniref:Uncharacterized protein n=1 Tax=Arthrobacter humicola TaxID=409291 RepID=A0ABP5KMX1_9MICC
MLNVRTWWAAMRATSAPRPAGEVTASTRDAELQYCWLLPGDVTYSAVPSTPEA